MLASSDTSDTAQLVQSAQVGSIEAFATLVQRYEREIYRYLVVMLGDRDEAQDFVQQVFFKAWLNLAALRKVACFKVWLYSIARNLICDHWRRQKLSCQSWEELVEDKAEPGLPGPEECIGESEIIRMALLELPLKLRKCLVLHDVYGLYPREIAKMVGIGKSSVSTYISMARRQFRVIFKRLKKEQESEERIEV